MANRNVRWIALTLLALANLLFWAGVAAAIALIASPGLDLGLEGRLRDGQATAVAVWERLDEQLANPAATPPAADQTPAAAATGTAGEAPAGEEPIAAIVATRNPAAASTPRPGITATPPPGDAADSLPATPIATLVSRPLLLANPAISDVALLNAEMDRSAAGRAVQVRYGEEALNAEIATLWRNNPELPFRDVWVDLRRDQVVVTGRITVLRFHVRAEVTGQIETVECVPVLDIERLDIAGVMAPKFVQDRVEQMVQEAMAWYPADYALCLEQIVLEEARITAYGYRR